MYIYKDDFTIGANLTLLTRRRYRYAKSRTAHKSWSLDVQLAQMAPTDIAVEMYSIPHAIYSASREIYNVSNII